MQLDHAVFIHAGIECMGPEDAHSLSAASNRLWVVAPSMLTGRRQQSSSSESGVSHDLANPCGPWSASWATPAVMWSVSGPGIDGALQRLVC